MCAGDEVVGTFRLYGAGEPACWAPGACQDLGLEQRLPWAQPVRFTRPTSASRLHPPCVARKHFSKPWGWRRLSSPSGGVQDLGVWQQAGPWVPTGPLSSGRLLERKKDRCFSHCALRNPREMPGAGGEEPVDSPKGTGVGAPFTPDALNALSDLGTTTKCKAPSESPPGCLA